MIFYLSIILVLCFGYYTLSYAFFLLIKKGEILAGIGTILIAIIGTFFPILGLFVSK